MHVCHSEGERARQKIDVPLNGVWKQVPGAPDLSVSRAARLVGLTVNITLCIKNGPSPKAYPANLTTVS